MTAEDILEEIVGEIVDEYDTAEIAAFEQLGPGDFRVSARLPIDDLAEHTGMNISRWRSRGGDGRRVAGATAWSGADSRQSSRDRWLLTAETAEGRRNRVSTVRGHQISARPKKTEETTMADIR